MRWRLICSFLALAVMVGAMRWQGQQLVTPVSRYGILDLEFARHASRLRQLQLFWNRDAIFQNMYLDFLLIASYVWFFVSAVEYLKSRDVFRQWNSTALSLAVSAGVFDVCENFLMMLIFNGRFTPSLLPLVAGLAMIKFLLAGVVLIYCVSGFSFSLLLRRNRRN